jgi:hypothetical protein
LSTEHPIGDPISHGKYQVGLSCGVIHVGECNTFVGDVSYCNKCHNSYPWGADHTCPLTEAEIREQIAQDIEQYESSNEIKHWLSVEKAAAIARGKK